MFIKEVQVNGYGKLADKKLEFDKGINLVYGDN
jgi:uncharacterized protein YhaN